MFEPLPARSDFPKAEQQVLEFWERHNVFQRSLELRRDAPRFVFYEGPPTANGVPHPGHCLTRAIKDLFPRYRTMCGYLVERKAGWDTHGLPVEIEVCNELGIHSKEEIEQYGLDRFVQRCVRSVFRYVKEWEEMTRRLGFWVNLEDAYITYHQSYVESVWWGLKTLFERGLLYQGHKVVWWWAQGGTALSAGEVGEGYRTVKDPAVYVRFPLLSEPEAPARETLSEPEAQARDNLPSDAKVSLLIWTTTPWTLISNHFAAVGPDIDYALVHDKTTDEYLYIAAALVSATAEKVKHEFDVVSTCKGTDLVGLRYEPPFRACYYDRPSIEILTKLSGWSSARIQSLFLGEDLRLPLGERQSRLAWSQTTVPSSVAVYEHVGWRVTPAEFVTLDTGTGIVHQAPAYGEVDFALLQAEQARFGATTLAVPLINAVAPDGTFTEEAPQRYRGRWVKDCDEEIMQEMDERGILYHRETIEHEYPFCPRSEDDPLIQYARKSWFVRTSQFRDEFLKNNDRIYWLPDHIKEGRFGDFLRNNVDWALSRERYWGTPLPIWVCEQTGKMEAIGSYAELLAKPDVQGLEVWELAKKENPDLPDHLRVHKPYIDEITYASPFGEGSADVSSAKPRMRRVPEVIDCWWDAGSMPFAQWGFPHVEGSVQTFAERFPCDFISEAIDQTRGWFYGLLAISTLLFRSRESPHRKGGTGVPPVTEELRIRRRNLPHWEAGGSTYFATFRLRTDELSPTERTVVLDACRYWDGRRILLHAAVVMPDHAHLLFTPLEKEPGNWWSLAELMHSIKGYSSKEVLKLRAATGSLWLDEYYDRIIRNAEDFDEKWNYIVTNPNRRGLPKDYAWVWVEPYGESPDHGRDARATQLAVPFPHPYKTCVVLGHMMGEDGLKMSKRAKNYKEPGYIFDHYGADAMRWYFFSAQTPWTSVRFLEANIRDAQREFLVRLYNVFSFFNIYANIDRFDPGNSHEATEPRSHEGLGTGYRPVPERSELDRWISSELHRAVQFVREKMDRFENYPAAGRLNDFVDALSNWYVRRSRDRFWRAVAPDASSAANQDKWDAYNTLYEMLVTVSKLIAPFTPFIAETMYQNLCRSDGATERRSDEGEGKDPLCPLSVHLCDYPEADEALIDERLAEEMDLVRQIVSLGRAARTTAKLKVRQPLAEAEIILAKREHTGWLETHSDLIADELNIKRVGCTSEADHYVTYQIKPEFKAIGPKFGKLAPKIAAALEKLDAAEARKALSSTGELWLEVEGQRVHLTTHDVHVRLEARPGWAAAQGRAGVVVIKTELSPELREEGLVRELIHHVQGLRKQQDLAYEARITLYVAGPEEFLTIVRRFGDTVKHECLAEQLELAAPPSGKTYEKKIEGHAVTLAVVPR